MGQNRYTATTLSGKVLVMLFAWCGLVSIVPAGSSADAVTSGPTKFGGSGQIRYRSVSIDGINIFYREAGDPGRPTLLLLHGFSSSSYMFRDLIPLLSDRFHLIAPDYPGFGHSDAPTAERFETTFINLENVISKFVQVIGLKSFTLYMQDFGGPVGLRMAVKHPEWIDGLIIQNANAYTEGLPQQDAKSSGTKMSDQVVNPSFIRFLYQDGARDVTGLNPDAWTMDIAALQKPGAREIQAALIDDYYNNIDQYKTWQAYFREYKPRTLIVWGKNDRAFAPVAAEAYRRDLSDLKLVYFNTGHFALEESAAEIAREIKSWQ